jgi:NADPH-dependent 2,4-dienoyl-CoA reductase/sulfur reductase-like enzyme
MMNPNEEPWSNHYPYVIVGGGLAGASAIEGIRAHDKTGAILLLSRENTTPYHRPPLSKDLWFGKKKRDELPVYDDEFYKANGVQLALRREIMQLEPGSHTLWDDHETTYTYDKLLIATGGKPRVLPVEGEGPENTHYYRTLEDYLFLEDHIKRVQHILVVGGGFIGLELAAALRHVGKEVTIVYPEEYPLYRILPRDLGMYVAEFYREKGVETISGETLKSIQQGGGVIHALTHNGNTIATQLLVAGVGIVPSLAVADSGGLETGNGIEVDEYCLTSDPNIYAAGDVAEFPYLALEKRTRIEHWDHAIYHGKCAGANMAGAKEPYTHLPMFFSDFFELGWEAVGDLDSSQTVDAVWKDPMKEGVLFYLRDDVVRGVLLWNSWGKVDWAREVIKAHKPTTHDERVELLEGASV